MTALSSVPWDPPSLGTGGFLAGGQVFTNPPFAPMADLINHPPHYTAGSIEVIDILEQAAAVAPAPVLAGLQWQCLKYLLRMWLICSGCGSRATPCRMRKRRGGTSTG